MATAFRRKGRGADRRFVAVLDAEERELVASLMEQVADLLGPTATTATGDEGFDAVVAGIGLATPDTGVAPEDAESSSRDPALDRLLPAGHREDDEAAAEFRRLTEGGLRHRKASGLAASVAALRGSADVLVLDPPQAVVFVTAITDVRLVLGERLGLHEDEDLDRLEALADSLGPAEPVVHVLALYDFMTWLQESLASALMKR